MRKRITAAMLLLIVLLMPVSLYLMVSRSFDQMISRVEQSALREEAAIAHALTAELKTSDQSIYASALNAAQTMQTKYGSQEVHLVLMYNGTPMAGAAVSEEILSCGLTDTQTRSIYLSSSEQVLYIAHSLSGNIMLLTATDLSAIYADHHQQMLYAALVCVIGLLMAGILASVIAGGLTQPLRSLVRSANALRDGDKTRTLPKQRKDEIGELTSAFGAMAEAIDQREQALTNQARQKQELIDALAHEMRTPLTAIVGAARLSQKDPGRAAEMADMIVRQAMRLSTMDEDLMRITRMNHEQPAFIRFSSKAMAEEAIAAYDGIQLQGEDTLFTGNRELLILLMRNLINNALHSGSKQPVQVTLLSDGFSVSDTGCGMTTEQTMHAFQPFWKADKARTRSHGGTGLGLSVCKKIAELHQADLQIDSEPKKGTAVTLRFTTPLQADEDSET